MLSDNLCIVVKKINVAHEFTLNRFRKSEYPRGRGSYGLVYAIDGEAECRFSDGKRITVSKGDTLFILPQAAYSISTAGEFLHYTVNFEICEDVSSLKELNISHYILQREKNQHLERSFKKVVGIWQKKDVGYEMQSLGAFYELLSLFCLGYLDEKGDRTSRRLQSAKEYLEQNFNRPVRLEQLAYLSDMSVTNFRREWAKQYSEAPMQYRDSVRLFYAKEYLDCGYYTVSEIAQKCGFDDVSYFVRFFKKKTGITPGEYKKRVSPV